MSNQLEAWVERLLPREIPVLDSTLQRLRQLRSNSNVSAAKIGAEIMVDPMLTFKLMRLANAGKRGEFAQRIAIPEHAVMMLGLDAVFEQMQKTPVVEHHLSSDAASGLLRCAARAYHAACHAREWAIKRLDINPDEVYVAALLHGLGEMALWAAEPELMLILERDRLRQTGSAAEQERLGFTLEALSLALAQHHNLPPLVMAALHPESPEEPVRVRHVRLACRLSRDTERGWYDAAVIADLEQIAEARRLSLDETVAQVHRAAVEIARRRTFPGVHPPARWLPMLPGEWPLEEATTSVNAASSPARPQHESGDAQSRHHAAGTSATLHDVIAQTARSMSGMGLRRVVFALLTRDRTTLAAKYVVGVEEGAALRSFRFSMDTRHLFSVLMAKPQAVWMTPANRQKYAAYLNEDIAGVTSGHEFFAMSVSVHGRMVGLFYADGAGSALSHEGYEKFKTLCLQAATRMAHLTQST
ncbi:MAG: HDOD domain-containing protein [Methylophilaceae bacterium]|nr:HDOD domain-containing protein [Methylophilaceae bacterium]